LDEKLTAIDGKISSFVAIIQVTMRVTWCARNQLVFDGISENVIVLHFMYLWHWGFQVLVGVLYRYLG